MLTAYPEDNANGCQPRGKTAVNDFQSGGDGEFILSAEKPMIELVK